MIPCRLQGAEFKGTFVLRPRDSVPSPLMFLVAENAHGDIWSYRKEATEYSAALKGPLDLDRQDKKGRQEPPLNIWDGSHQDPPRLLEVGESQPEPRARVGTHTREEMHCSGGTRLGEQLCCPGTASIF